MRVFDQFGISSSSGDICVGTFFFFIKVAIDSIYLFYFLVRKKELLD